MIAVALALGTAARLRGLEVARAIAPPERRGELAAAIRRLTTEIEAAKVAAMQAEAA